MNDKVLNRFKLYFFIRFIGQGALYPYLVLLLNSKGVSGSSLGLLLMVIPLGKLLITPLSGYLCDLLRVHKHMLMIGLALNALGGAFLFTSAPAFSNYLFAVIIITLGESSSDAMINTLTIDYLSRTQRQTDFGRLRLWGAWGFMGSSFLLGLFDLQVTISLVPLIFAIANALSLTTALNLPRSSASRPVDWLGGIKMVMHNAPFALILVGMIFAGMAFSIILNYYPVYLQDIGAASWMIGFGVALQTGVEIILSANTRAITQRFPLRSVYLFGFGALLLRCLLFAINQNPTLGLAIQNLHGFFFFSSFIVGLILLETMLQPEWRSTGQAYYYSAFSGLGAMLGAFSGPLIYAGQGMTTLWLFAGGIALVSFALLTVATLKMKGSPIQIPDPIQVSVE